jgi:hypothetical protein
MQDRHITRRLHSDGRLRWPPVKRITLLPQVTTDQIHIIRLYKTAIEGCLSVDVEPAEGTGGVVEIAV